LSAGIGAGGRVETELTRLVAPEVFALHLDARPLDDEIGNPQLARAAERLRDAAIVKAALSRRSAEVRQPGSPCRLTGVAAEMAEQRPGAGAILVRIGRRKGSATAELAAQLDQQVGRRHPFHLHAVVVPAAAEKRLVGQRRVLEIPGVLMDRVLVADRREEAPALEREAAAELQRLEKSLLDLDFVFRRQRGDQLAAKVRIDIRGDDELGLA